MCGLVGFSGKKNYNTDILKFLLFWNAEERRSKDSTGIYTPKSGVIKDNVEAKLFINDKKLTSKINADKVLVGHVRAKTVGTNTVNNAHPFEYDDIIMAHNGTLENHIILSKMYQLKHSEYNVDSQVLAKCISINTIYDDKIKVLEQFEGAAAIVYYNKNTETLYAFHDKNRPLFYGYVADTEMYISSIKESLEAVGCLGITEFEINNLYEIKEGKIVGKTLYHVSDRSTMVEQILAENKDMITKSKKGNLVHRCKKEKITGFEYGSFKATYAKGFWILCDSGGKDKDNSELNKKHELLNYGEWYYILGEAKGKQYDNQNLIYLEVQNEEGESGIICTTAKFNIRLFIPQKGKYVRSMCNLVYNDSTRAKIADEGDLMIVREYVYGDKTIVIYNPKTNKIGVVPIHLVRLALNDEVKKYIEQQVVEMDTIQRNIDFSSVNSPLQLPAKTEDSSKTNDAKTLLEPKSNKSKFKNVEDLTYSYQTICNIVLATQQALREIKNFYETYDYSEAEAKVEELDQQLELLFDPEIIEGMTPFTKEDDENQEEFSEHVDHVDC